MTMTRATAIRATASIPSEEGAKATDLRLSAAVILYLLSLALPIHFNVGPIFMTGTRAVLLVMIVPLTLRLFAGHFGRVLPTDVLLLVYGLWSIGTLAVNSPDQAISFGGSYMLEVYGSYLLARAFIRTPAQFRAACLGLLAVLVWSLPFAMYETQTGRALIPQFIAKLPIIYSVADYDHGDAGRRLGLERAQAIFVHPIHYGVFAATLFSLAFVGFKIGFGSFPRYLLAVSVCLGVVCSVSSGAILPMVFQLGLIAWAWVFNYVKSRWVILSSLTLLAYVVVDMLSNRTPIVILLEHVALSPDTAYGRVIIFEWGMVNVWKNPLLGLGLNEWERPWWKSASMDNFWLLTTVRYGIPGFLLLAGAYLALFWRAMWRDVGADGTVWHYRRAWVFSQVAMIMALCTVDVWATVLSYTFFLFGMGAWFLTWEAARETSDAHQDAAVLPARLPGAQRYSRFPSVGRRRQATASLRAE